MKECGQDKKVTLPIHGREMTFSKQELIAILEKHFPDEAVEQVTTAKVAQKPTEDQWFEVNPLDIDLRLFRDERKDESQETTRVLILDAVNEAMKAPKKYGRTFETMMPTRTWFMETAGELKLLASRLGDHNADWVEQCLEWGQRLSNGESWEEVCNNADTAVSYRLVVWREGYGRLLGGSSYAGSGYAASDIGVSDYQDRDTLYCTVPLVVRYK